MEQPFPQLLPTGFPSNTDELEKLYRNTQIAASIRVNISQRWKCIVKLIALRALGTDAKNFLEFHGLGTEKGKFWFAESQAELKLLRKRWDVWVYRIRPFRGQRQEMVNLRLKGSSSSNRWYEVSSNKVSHVHQST